MTNITVDHAVNSGKPYVYLLCFPDGTPFYVGKGTNGRVYQHLWEAQHNHEQTPKLDAIRELAEQGHEPLLQIDSLHDTDESAFSRETALIFEYGMIKDQTGILTNRILKSGRTCDKKGEFTDFDEITFTMKLDRTLHQKFKECVKNQVPKETMTRVLTSYIQNYIQGYKAQGVPGENSL